MKSIAWKLFVVLTVVAGQYYFVSAYGSEPNADLYTAIGVVCVLAAFAGIVVNRPAAKVAWFLVAASLALYIAGDIVYARLEADNAFVAFPSTADWIYLAMYPVLIVGLLLVHRSVVPGRSTAATVDGAIVGVATFAVLGVLYANLLIQTDFLDLRDRVLAVAYPVGDALLVAVAARLVLAARRPSPAIWSVLAGIAALTAGNAVFNVQSNDFSFAPAGWAEVGWLAFTTFLALAALHPSMTDRLEPVDHDEQRSPWRVAGRAVAVAAIPTSYLTWGESSDRGITLGLGAAAAVLLVARWRAGRRAVEREHPGDIAPDRSDHRRDPASSEDDGVGDDVPTEQPVPVA